MTEYKLGPNGAIVTALNLFATQFADVMTILEKRKNDYEHIIVDTPGQIEAFTWSASGQLIAESLASTFATNVVYVVDTPRTSAPATFMSNMVYACSILHKYRLPLTAAFNKCDVADHKPMFTWMEDFEAFHEALIGLPKILPMGRAMSPHYTDPCRWCWMNFIACWIGSRCRLWMEVASTSCLSGWRRLVRSMTTRTGGSWSRGFGRTKQKEKIAAEDLARLQRDMASDDSEIVPGAASQAAKEGRRLP